MNGDAGATQENTGDIHWENRRPNAERQCSGSVLGWAIARATLYGPGTKVTMMSWTTRQGCYLLHIRRGPGTAYNPEKPLGPGRAVMSCNLGALSGESEARRKVNHRYPTDDGRLSACCTSGTKGPVSPLRYIASEYQDYNDGIYGSALATTPNQVIEVHKTSAADETKLFTAHLVIGSSLTGAVRHAIANPTVFISGTNAVKQNEAYVREQLLSIMATGVRPEKATTNLGGLEPAADGMKAYTVNSNNNVCLITTGRRNPLTPSHRLEGCCELCLEHIQVIRESIRIYDDINYDDKFANGYGMNMAVQKWKDGLTSYFPTQERRMRRRWRGIQKLAVVGTTIMQNYLLCNRVNRVLHIHKDHSLFHSI